jgi:hypothetical protein
MRFFDFLRRNKEQMRERHDVERLVKALQSEEDAVPGASQVPAVLVEVPEQGEDEEPFIHLLLGEKTPLPQGTREMIGRIGDARSMELLLRRLKSRDGDIPQESA